MTCKTYSCKQSNYMQLSSVKNNIDPSPMYTKYWPMQYSHCNSLKILESLLHLSIIHFQYISIIHFQDWFLYFWLKNAEIHIDKVATES